jgi:hypothetical protein
MCQLDHPLANGRAELLPNSVQRAKSARIVMNQKGAVGFEHQQANGLGEPRRQAARVEDFAAGDDQPHGRRTVLSLSDSDDDRPEGLTCR